ncbi:MAG: hypothetical protein J6X30_00930, partial [Clostridia bacterium]|nr:hypothetical protein [Clostridia bacterium]
MNSSRLRSLGIAAAVILSVILVLLFILLPQSDRFRRNGGENDPTVSSDPDAPGIGMLLYGISEAPYGPGDVMFHAAADGQYRYR